MHVMVLPSWYETKKNKTNGIFFEEQAKALSKKCKVGFIVMNAVSFNCLENLTLPRKKNLGPNINFMRESFITIPKIRFIQRILKKSYFKRTFNEYVKKNGLPDIVHLHSWSAGDLALYLKEKYDIPYIVTEHSTDPIEGKLTNKHIEFCNLVYKEASIRLSVSEMSTRFLQQFYKYDFCYIPNMVDIEKFNVSLSGKNNKRKKYISIGGLLQQKRHDRLIKAFKHLITRNESTYTCKLTIYGEGPERQNLLKLIKELNMSEFIDLPGVIPNSEIANVLKDSDYFVLASDIETFGIVFIEALASGIPVIATKCGGPESIIINEKFGFLVDRSEEQLYKAMINIQKIQYDPVQLRNYVINNFSQEVIVKMLVDKYQSVLN